jgi:hypothetical protein
MEARDSHHADGDRLAAVRFSAIGHRINVILEYQRET